MSILLRNVLNCIGLSGNISIRNQVVGVGTHFSLLEMARLVKDKQHLRLHIKIVANPISFTLDEMVDSMRQVFHNIGIPVIIRTVENLSLPNTFLDITVGGTTAVPCSGPTSDEQNQLFNNRNNVGANDIVVYFVRGTIPALNGCATFPSGRPGAIVTRGASRWSLAHEVGHVLGLNHIDSKPNWDFDKLMTGGGTDNITNPPPDLTSSETTTMNNSALTREC